jgi:hypothetical protein
MNIDNETIAMTLSPNQSADLNDAELSEAASRLFARVSAEKPSSVAAQAALIARECQRSKLMPDKLSEALLGDDHSISRLTNAAISAHLARGIEIRITEADTRGIIGHDFCLAGDLMILPGEQLDLITDKIYKTYYDQRSQQVRMARRMINKVRGIKPTFLERVSDFIFG